MPELLGGREVEGQVVDEHALRRGTPGALGAELVHARATGLRMPSSPEITMPSNSSSNSSCG